MSRLLSTPLATLLLLGSLGLFGCDDATDDPLVANASPMTEQAIKQTDGGAFMIVLSAHHGLAVGENRLKARVGFHNADVPGDLGVGVPNADVTMLVWMPEGDGAVDHEVAAQYVGDGVYEFDAFALDQVGVWRFDIDIDAGRTIRESVSFGFVVE